MKDWLVQNAFLTLKMLNGNLGTLCASFYRIGKTVFFLKPDLIPKILIKAKGIVIYHGNNNGGNNSYCDKVTYRRLKILETIIIEAVFFLSEFTFTSIHDSQNNWGRGRLSL